jgi:hypothetical protein
VGRGDAITAVVLYSSILASPIRVLVGTRSSSTQSFLRSCLFAWGGPPNATMAGHPVQISASLSGGNPLETYICNSSRSPLRADR